MHHVAILIAIHRVQGAKTVAEKEKLEQQLTRAREAFNRAARPLIRKLTVLDFPEELLCRIFEFVEAGEYDTGYPTDPHQRPEVAFPEPELQRAPEAIQALQNSRLVCHRFHDASSQFLVRRVEVIPTGASLARLEQISRHPTISKGVLDIELTLTRHDTSLVDYQAFKRCLVDVLEEMELGSSSHSMHILHVTHRQLMQRGDFLASLCQMLAPDAADEVNDPEGQLYMAQVQQLHNQYVAIVREQDRLFDRQGKLLVRSVVDAMTRMPRARRLLLHDPLDEIPLSRLNVPTALIWDRIEEFMLQPHPNQVNLEGAEEDDEPPRPRREHPFVLPLLVALGAAGICLNTFRIALYYPTDYALFDPEAQKTNKDLLTTGMKRLKHFAITYDANDQRDNEVDGIRRLVAACVATPSLESLSISTSDDNAEGGSLDGLIDPVQVLGVIPRHNLSTLSLAWVAFDAEEFKELLERLPTPMKFIMLSQTYLRTGGGKAWREILDALRQKECESVFLDTPYVPRRPGIVTHGEISDRAQRSIFRGRVSLNRYSRAEVYVRAGSAQEFPQNPFDLYEQKLRDR
ncbi:hypothetical protein V8F20_001334 [Naviculisporaceae sp. PSN 640]